MGNDAPTRRESRIAALRSRYGPYGPVVHRSRIRVPGVLLIYHRLGGRTDDASTIYEHIDAYSQFSQFPYTTFNTALGFQAGLWRLEFDAVVLHYSAMGMGPFFLNEEWMDWLAASSAYKVAFFQDEYVNVGYRHSFVANSGIDAVFTMLEPSEFAATYGRVPGTRRILSNLPGYVGPALLRAVASHARPRNERRIDVGYRGRELPAFLGRAALEKAFIGTEFARRSADLHLTLDLDTTESGRLYGDAWWRFLGDCRCVLGVESGVSAFDIDDRIFPEYHRLLSRNGHVSVEDLAHVLADYEDRIYYRTVSPRHFEAAAFRCLQVLFEGAYSGAMQPWVHYVPLKKDFSNFDEVLAAVLDESLASELTDNAYRDLIESGAYDYERLIGTLDAVLTEAGLDPSEQSSSPAVASLLRMEQWKRRWWHLRTANFPTARERFTHVIDRIYSKTPQAIIGPLAWVRYDVLRRQRPAGLIPLDAPPVAGHADPSTTDTQ